LALDSTQKAQTNFTYIIKIEVDGNEVVALPISSNIDGYGVIDAHKHIENYVTNSIDTTSLATFRKIEDSYVEYSFKLFEQYDVSGTTTQFSAATYTATTYAYNGVEDWLDFRNYDYTDYVISSASTGNFLCTIPTDGVTMKTTDSSYINFYNQTTNTTNFLEVTTSNGGVYRITNPWQTSVAATKFLQAAIGPFNIANTTSTVTMMSGTYPIIQDTTEYYDVRLLDVSGNPTSQSIRVNIDRRCSKYDTYQMLYLDKSGSYLNFNFDLAHKVNTTVSKKSYNKRLGSFNPNTLEWGYSLADRSKKIMDVTINDKYTITSNWVTQADSNRIVDLISSPEVYQLLDGTVTYSAATTDNVVGYSNNGGLLQLTVTSHGLSLGTLVRLYDTIPAYNNVYAYITSIDTLNAFTVNLAYNGNTLTGIDKIDTQTITVTSGDLIAVNIDTNSIETKQKVNTKMINYTIDFSYTFTNYRQRN
jgi:hypothetical protein